MYIKIIITFAHDYTQNREFASLFNDKCHMIYHMTMDGRW